MESRWIFNFYPLQNRLICFQFCYKIKGRYAIINKKSKHFQLQFERPIYFLQMYTIYQLDFSVCCCCFKLLIRCASDWISFRFASNWAKNISFGKNSFSSLYSSRFRFRALTTFKRASFDSIPLNCSCSSRSRARISGESPDDLGCWDWRGNKNQPIILWFKTDGLYTGGFIRLPFQQFLSLQNFSKNFLKNCVDVVCYVTSAMHCKLFSCNLKIEKLCTRLHLSIHVFIFIILLYRIRIVKVNQLQVSIVNKAARAHFTDGMVNKFSMRKNHRERTKN